MFRIMTLLVFLLLFVWIVSSVYAAGDDPKLYMQDNVLAVGNYNDGTSSSDISLIIRIEVDGDVVVDEGDDVKYIVPLSDDDHSEDWIEIAFDDSGWEDGISGVGYSDGDDNTVVPGGNVAAIYTRYYFDVPKANSADDLKVLLDYDDAYVVWINGVEVGRSINLKAKSPEGEIPAWDLTAPRGAITNRGATEMAAGQPNEARWAAGNIEKLDVAFDFGGQSALSVELQGKLSTLWGSLKSD